MKKESITFEDIPEIDYQTDLNIPYSKFSDNGKSISITDEYESFNLKSFVISKDNLAENELILTSKGELAKSIKLHSISPTDHINKKRYLFLLSGNYIDLKDSDTRGSLIIPTKDEFKKNPATLFTNKEIRNSKKINLPSKLQFCMTIRGWFD